MTEARARRLLERPVFGKPSHIAAVHVLEAAAEIDEAIRACPHYHNWEYSLRECCSRMNRLAYKYPDLFNSKMNAYHGTTGRWV